MPRHIQIQVEGRDIEPERQMRRVTLIGSPESIQWAHYLIGQVMRVKLCVCERERLPERNLGVELVKCTLGRM